MAFPLPDFTDEETGPLWRAARNGRLGLPSCKACGRIDWYPRGTCRSCNSAKIGWEVLSGTAVLFSWAIVRRALDQRLDRLVPYISAIVTLAEDPQSRFVTRLVDVAESDLSAGMELTVCFRDLGFPGQPTGVIAPLFTRRKT